LILAQKETAGTATKEQVYAINSETLADGYFGRGSILARMCRAFKQNNPNTALHAMALSETGTVRASGVMSFGGSATTDAILYLMVGGEKAYVNVTSGWSGADVASAVVDAVASNPNLCVIASISTVTTAVLFKAVGSGEIGNYYDVRANYYDGQSDPPGITYVLSALAGGSGNPALGGAWAVIENEQYQHIVQPYTDASLLASLETELATRFEPLTDLQGHGYGAVRGALASCLTLGNSRNSPHNTIIGAYNSPTNPEIWAAGLGAVASQYLNNDPARPLHFLQLKGVLPPPTADRFSRAERDQLLYDGIASFVVGDGGEVLLERCITTYQTNALGTADPTFLDIQTLFTLLEIRYQFKVRMASRFIIPRFKLADDTFPVQPGSFVATPKTIRSEIISLFTDLRDKGLIENLDEFVTNLVVERDATDQNRVNVLLPPDLINQFRVLAGLLQFIL
jgi:phage tail sheath gpL-like